MFDLLFTPTSPNTTNLYMYIQYPYIDFGCDIVHSSDMIIAAVECRGSYPGLPNGFHVSTGTRTYKQRVPYTCRSGYDFRNDHAAEVICEADGQFSWFFPRICERKIRIY